MAFIFVAALVQAQIPSGAVGYWPFDNNALDMSGNGSNGTATNVTPYFDRFGNANKAYKFNGINSKVVIPHNMFTDVAPNQDFTIGVWEKAYNSNPSAIISKHVSGNWNGYSVVAGNNADPGYCIAPGHIFFYTASGAQQDACSNADLLKDSTWHFLVGTYKASTQTNNFYVDGILQTDIGGSSGGISNPANLSFGFDAGTNNGFFNGVLDGGRLYKRVLSQAEITNLFNEINPSGTASLSDSQVLGSQVSIFPNPTKGKFDLSVIAASKNLTLEVFTALGQSILVQTIVSETTTIDLEHFSGGIYYLKLNGSEVREVVKLVKE
ncbi:MAG TPA: T9SS type A sorting domain-containing protein [Bacteroidia bacterium]|nr:T9SS type A sorting domain-containing protein [Bacteroidia bacterium]